MEGQLVRLTDLPSRGVTYPDDMELYVKPLSIREQMEMDRYGISQAEYYQILLDGITIRGNYNVNKLWFHDVQFMDIIRRLFTFDTEEEIVVSDYPCDDRYCTGKVILLFCSKYDICSSVRVGCTSHIISSRHSNNLSVFISSSGLFSVEISSE